MIGEEEFGIWVSKNSPALLRTARRLVGDTHQAEDLVQETFRSAWTGRSLFEDGRHDGAWLFSILRRRIADYWRRNKSEEALDSQSCEISTSDPDPFLDELSEDMKSALESLPKGMREVFVLVASEGLTHREASVRLGVPIGTVLSRFSRARERMFKSLSEA